MKIVIAGGSGFVGQHLARLLVDRGEEVVVLSRSVDRSAKFREVAWDGRSVGDWASEVEGADYVFNLSGSPVEKKWTEAVKRGILSSRVDSTRAIHAAIERASVRPKAWVNASAVGWYGDRGDEILAESSRPGSGFLAETCEAWERCCLVPDLEGVKQVAVRIGIVLGREGGAFPILKKLTDSFAGGAAGDGRQWMPWIHVEDLARLLAWAAESAQEGPINGCSPDPARNGEMMSALRAEVGRPFSPAVPSFMLGIGAGLMGKEPSVLLMSQRAVPTLALAQGFEFSHRDLRLAIRSLL